ncbi:outer membrane beta-barrel protein [Croceitalea rosinachiae]|uniref:Outer membrane beta-barrel protein n=1 Tax=Croceitalea rosinachiae TaxID=3075596 RepID=A0ABU3AF41_9FLAO|nr:outer membrane beta-barrel protein [Croceitalea sp. F388]MDT0608538.1 outer membrane beta-barrel protein [Croceitalea sp. F388]
MKKLIIATVFVLSFTFTIYAQEGFSAKAGINNVTFDVDGFGSTSELGFYLGGSYTFDANGEIQIEPSVLVSIVDDLTALYIPVMAKYPITDKFNVQAGPQINYLLEDVDEGAFGLDLGFGGGFNIDDNWFVEARYAFEILRDLEGGNINTLTAGVGYRFD